MHNSAKTPLKVLPVLATAAVLLAASNRPAQPPHEITIYKNPGCQCCDRWASQLETMGFQATIVETDTLQQVFAYHGVVDEHRSCHIGLVEGYVAVGHVPGREVLDLLQNRPRAIGVAVPGMPVGSPGMEVDGVDYPEYDVLTIVAEGSARTSARYRGSTRLD